MLCGESVTSHEQKQIIADLAESLGLQGVSVGIRGVGHVYFIKKDGRVLHDRGLYFDEARCLLSNYDSRREDTANDGR